MELFKSDLAAVDIDALQTEQDRLEQQRNLEDQIRRRRNEMDKRNKKTDRVATRTANAKHMVFQTSDRQKYMITNQTTLDKLDAPVGSVLDFVKQQRDRVPRQSHLPC